MVFEEVFTMLGSYGVYAIYLPFLLLFSLFFAILEKTGILGKKPRINALIAFIMAVYITAYSPIAGGIGIWFANLFATTGVTLVSILVFAMILGLLLSPWWDQLFKKNEGLAQGWKSVGALGIIIGFLVLTGSTFGIEGSGSIIEIPGLTSQDMVFLVLLIITLIIIWYIVGGGGKAGDKVEAILPLDWR